VLGVVAEGKQYGSVLVLADDSSARLWTGQPYGAEGGLMGTAAFIAGFLATFAWVRSQRHAGLRRSFSGSRPARARGGTR
jgi:hypothetical protein